MRIQMSTPENQSFKHEKTKTYYRVVKSSSSVIEAELFEISENNLGMLCDDGQLKIYTKDTVFFETEDEAIKNHVHILLKENNDKIQKLKVEIETIENNSKSLYNLYNNKYPEIFV